MVVYVGSVVQFFVDRVSLNKRTNRTTLRLVDEENIYIGTMDIRGLREDLIKAKKVKIVVEGEEGG